MIPSLSSSYASASLADTTVCAIPVKIPPEGIQLVVTAAAKSIASILCLRFFIEKPLSTIDIFIVAWMDFNENAIFSYLLQYF